MSLRNDLAKLKEMVKNKTSKEVEFVFSKLLEAYPELSKFKDRRRLQPRIVLMMLVKNLSIASRVEDLVITQM